jgi:hypothetical protein
VVAGNAKEKLRLVSIEAKISSKELEQCRNLAKFKIGLIGWNDTSSTTQIKPNPLTIDNYFKETYQRGKLVKADDKLMESIQDSLFSGRCIQPFYFVVFTKSMNGADGFISEGIGDSAFRFITTRTDDFANYFNRFPELNEQDLGNWAQYIFGEIQITREHEELKGLRELENLLSKNEEKSTKENQTMISRLIKRIRNTAHEKGFL